MYIVFHNSNQLSDKPAPSHLYQTTRPCKRLSVTDTSYPLLLIYGCLPDVHLIFIYHMAEESTNDDGTEEVRVVGHGDKHELGHEG